MSKWLKSAKEKLEKLKAASAEKEETGVVKASSGFLCALCDDLDLGTLDALQAHYLEKHSADDDDKKPEESDPNESSKRSASTSEMPIPQPAESIDESSASELVTSNKSEDRAQNASLRIELQDLKESYRKLKNEKESAEKINAEMVNDLVTKLECAEASQRSIEELDAKLAAEVAAHATFKAEVANEKLVAIHEAETQERKLKNLSDLLDQSRADVGKLNAELKERPYAEEVAALNAEIVSLKQNANAADPAAEVVDSASLARAVGEANALRRRLEDAEAALTTKSEELARHMQNMEQEATSSRAKDVELAQLKATVDSLQLTITENVKAQDLLRADVESKSAEVLQLSEQNLELRKVLETDAAQNERIEQLERELEAKYEEIKQEKCHCASLKTELDSVTTEMESIRKSVAEEKRANSVSTNEASAQLETAQHQLDQMRKKQEAKNKDVLELRDKVVEYKDLLEASKAEKVELRNKLREESRLASEVAEKVRQQVLVTDDLQRAVDDARFQLQKQLRDHDAKVADLGASKDKEAAELRQRIATLESDLEAVGLDIAKMAQQSDSSGAQSEKLSEELESAKAETQKALEELAMTKETLEARCAELETANADMRRREEELQSKLTASSRDAESTKESLSELEANNVQLETEMGELAKKYRQSQKDVKSMHSMIEETKKLFITQKLDLQRENKAAKQILVETQLKLKESDAEREKLKSRSGSELSTLRRNIELAEKESDSLRRELNETRDELSSELKILQANIASTQQRLDDANKTIENMRGEMDQLKSEKRTAEEGMREALNEKETLVERCIAGEKKLNTLANKFNRLNQDLKTRTAALTELGEENSELQRTINEMGSRTWQSSKGTKHCSECKNKFTQLNRKHHCRNCGMIFCNSCSSKTAKTSASKSKVRVCNSCYQELS